MTSDRTYELVHTVEHDEMSYPNDEEGWRNVLKIARNYGWLSEHSYPAWYLVPDGRLVSERDARAMGKALKKAVDDLPGSDRPSPGTSLFERLGGFAKRDFEAFVTFAMRCSFTINKGV